jgi:hypothetical protein
MANDNPKWESMREKYTTATTVGMVGFGVVVVAAAYFYKDFDYAKNLWALIRGVVGLAAGYMFGSNNTKPSEATARSFGQFLKIPLERTRYSRLFG